MEINYEALAMFGKFGGMMLGLLLLVWLIALLTPKAAGLIDKLRKPSPERVQDSFDSENEYKVYSIFEDRPDGAVNGRSPQNAAAQKDDAQKPAGAALSGNSDGGNE